MPEQPLLPSSVLVDTNNAEQQRAERIWRFVNVMAATWLFFACFLSYRCYFFAANVCIYETLAYLIIIVMCAKYRHGEWLTHLNIGLSGLGIFVVAVSDPAMARTLLYFPASIVVSSQLHGVRTAFTWLCINLITIVAFFLVTCGSHALFHTAYFDEVVLTLGVSVCIFFCCQQSEQYFQLKTRNLIDLSQDLRQRGQELSRLATTDSLTGLLNRFEFQNRLDQSMAHSVEESESMALYLLDMDGFKAVNDSLGHAVGDDALIEVAARLTKEFGQRADIARLGGDEFCLIYRDVSSEEHALAIAQRVWKILTQRYILPTADFQMGASVGFALSPALATTAKDLLTYADTAMFYAKERQKGFARYEPEMTNQLNEHRSTQDKLAGALARDEFFLVYQPQIDLKTNTVVGVESLLRWRNDGKVMMPGKFIPLLEANREIATVSKWVVRESCKQWAEWKRLGIDLSISINVSTLQFNSPDFFDKIVESIREFDVDPCRLDFEITEGQLVDDIDQARSRLMQLRELGATISIDDFGTGYSSLSYLRQFPIDRLKIDQSFIREIPDTDDGVIAASVIVLAKTLGLKSLAEGVESEAQRAFLLDHNCDEFQGNLFSKPVSASEVTGLLKANHESQVIEDSTTRCVTI